MLTWLAVYLVGTLCLPTAAGVFSALGCLAATLFCGRDAPLCGVPAEKLRYSKIEYACALGLLVSGSALLSFATSLVLRFGGAGQAAAAGQGNFLAALVFSCLVPASLRSCSCAGACLGFCTMHTGVACGCAPRCLP